MSHYLKNELYELIKTDESIFDFIQESSLDGLWYWDLENPENEWMNPKFWTVLGYNPDEMPHKSNAWQNIINQDDLKIASENFTKHCENSNHPYDQLVRYTHKNGSIIWIRCRGMAIRDKNGKAVRMFGAHYDITETKNAELLLKDRNEEYESLNEELQQTNEELYNAKEKAENSEEKYRALYNNAPLSYQSLDENGCFIDINPMWSKTLGYERNEVIGRWYGDYLHPEYVEHFKINFPAFKKRGYVSNVQFKLRRKDNSYIYVSFEGCVGYTPEGKFKQTYCVFKDITEQKALENAIIKAKDKAEESERKLKEAQRIAHMGNWELNIETNELFWSDEIYRIFDCEPQEFNATYKAFLEFIHPDDREKVNAAYSNSLETQTEYQIEHRLITKNHQIKYVREKCTTIFTDQGKPLNSLGIVIDITEQKALENDLIKAKENAEAGEERFNLAMKASNDGLFDWNLETNEIYYSPGWKKMLGYEEHELPNDFSVWEKTTDPEDVKKSWELQQKLINKQIDRFVMEFKMKHKNGHWVDILSHAEAIFNENGKAVRIVGTHTDITERMLAEEKAHQKDIEFRKLSSNLPDLIYQFTRKPDGSYCFPIASEGIKNIFGCSPEDVINDFTPVAKVIYPDDAEKVINDIEYSAKHLTFFKCEFRVQIPGKPIQWIISTSTPEKLADGSITWYGFIADITERKHAELELIKAKEKAEEANRLKTEFLKNMSHEIRTPMNGIIGFSEMLDKPDVSEEKRRYFSKIVQNSSHQLLRIIDDILEISTLETKQEKLIETEFCLNELFMDLFSIINLKSKERNIPLYLKKALQDKQSHIISDKTKLNKILSNLLENALKFTSEGFIEFGYSIDKAKLIIYVKDTGIGISPKNHEIVFERFLQEDKEISRKHGGLGLGLSICKENAQLLSGDITLESEKGKGSTFYVTIPYKPVQAKNISAVNSLPENLLRNDKYTILVAEDEEVNYLYIEALFEDEIEDNYDLIHAKNGKEAVDICASNKNIDLVLMDIKMPIMNGHEATEKIKKTLPNLPIIAQTAYSTETDKQMALKQGCDDFISKPISKEKLVGLIIKYLKM